EIWSLEKSCRLSGPSRDRQAPTSCQMLADRSEERVFPRIGQRFRGVRDHARGVSTPHRGIELVEEFPQRRRKLAGRATATGDFGQGMRASHVVLPAWDRP